jgi:DNA-binding GntR family transcriptional regulator
MAERVAAALRDAIADGRLRPGDRLVEQKLASQLKVSRSPVREAIRRLELEGLVVGQPHRGVSVASLSADDIRDLYQVRASLEALAGRLATSRLAEADQRRLAEIVRAMRTAAQRRDRRRLSTLDAEFHQLIGRACGNRWLIRILDSLRLQIREFIAINLLYDDPGLVARQHANLLTSLRHDSAQDFASQLQAHVAAAGEKAFAARTQGGLTDRVAKAPRARGVRRDSAA